MKRLLMVMLLLVLAVPAAAEDEIWYWALCNPDSYITVRESPSKTGTTGGYLYCGDEVQSDGQTRGEWVHVVNTSTEAGEGWVHGGYLTDSPVTVSEVTAVTVKGQVRVRSRIEGRIIKRLKKGTAVTVYAISEGWAVTSSGYIKADLLEVQDAE